MTHRPLDSGRNPFELFLLCLGLLSGIPLLFGAPPPGTLAELLSPDLVHAWAAILVFGCGVALCGVWWSWWGWLGRIHPRLATRPTTGLLIEQVGLFAVGGGTLIYGVGIIGSGRDGTGIATGIVLAYGMACFWRFAQIKLWVRAAIREQHKGE